LGDCDDFDWATFGAIDDQIIANWPEQHQVASEVFTYVADAGILSECLKRIE
jgi:hypothetical protein